uniref:Uncharacterized protein n=1 Tax=Setaria digitata TaxID=48799 RepID=A0A915PUV2_9BILA
MARRGQKSKRGRKVRNQEAGKHDFQYSPVLRNVLRWGLRILKVSGTFTAYAVTYSIFVVLFTAVCFAIFTFFYVYYTNV